MLKSSLAGHLGLDNLVLIYDSNNICLDGPLSETCTEDTAARYRSYGWDVFEVDGHSFDELDDAFLKITREQTRPTIVIAHTVIGKGSPHKAGTHKVHGSPLGQEEVVAAKETLGLPEEAFFVPQAVKSFFERKLEERKKLEDEWQSILDAWKVANGDKWTELEQMQEKSLPHDLESRLQKLDIASPIAGRKASHAVLEALGDLLPQLVGGSADLSSSDMTRMMQWPLIATGDFSGRNIKFGVREFAMGTMATGLSQSGFFTPFVGTFLVFSDYMRNAIRLAAMQKQQVVYQLTHDSIFLGEDGPTHQPVEQLASLRAIPNLHVIRPADAREVVGAWLAALNYVGPTAIVLSRQNLPEVKGSEVSFEQGVSKGAYIVRREKDRLDYTLMATGSELTLAIDVAHELEKRGKGVRVVSMPCFELFERQSTEYQKSILGDDIGKRVSIEAGVEQSWHKYIGREGIAIAIDSFGASAPANSLAEEFGFTADAILERIL
jgi:transketolase